jgi:hypothetical protein
LVDCFADWEMRSARGAGSAPAESHEAGEDHPIL